MNQASSRNLPLNFNQNTIGLKFKQSDRDSDSSGAQKTILRQQNSEIIEPQIQMVNQMEINYNNYKEHPYAGSQSNLNNKALEKIQYIQE